MPVIRETPAPSPFQDTSKDPSFQVALKVGEPVLRMENIQGNIIGGFTKDHRLLIFMEILDASNFQKWLSGQIGFIANAAEVVSFNRLFKYARTRRGSEGAVKSTWTNIAFSFEGLKRLETSLSLGLALDEFADEAFVGGLASRSAMLGDPHDVDAEGHPSKWLIGGPENEAHVVLILESDERSDLLGEFTRIDDSLKALLSNDKIPVDAFAKILHIDEGANLPAPLSGHEHFGFLDGISQPGIRGLVSTDPTDVLTPRQQPDKRDQLNARGQIVTAQGKPGQDLLWPGEFVFGYPKQKNDPTTNDDFDGPNASPGLDSLAGAAPMWAADGSYLVYRRLRQKVGVFHGFLRHLNKTLKVPLPPDSSKERYLGAKLVGRWPSGAPIERAVDNDNISLGDDDCNNNNFEFQDGTDPLPAPIHSDPFACVDIGATLAQADQDGVVCPFSAHIRKSYPRDEKSSFIPNVDESSTQTHRLLRRGMPYGPVSASTFDAPVEDGVDRGLQFLAYQTSIVNQFEFVTQSWVNNSDFKEKTGSLATLPPTPISPGVQGGGIDPIIGQNPNGRRERTFTVTLPDAAGHPQAYRISTEAFIDEGNPADWVVPTGGGYFFSPSIDGLRLLANA